MTMRQRLAHIALGGVFVLSGMVASDLLQTSDAQQTANIVKAREFHLVDESGFLTAIIAPYSSQTPGKGHGFVVRNSAGKEGMTFVIDTQASPGGKLSLLNSNGVEAVRLVADPIGGSLFVRDRNGKTVVDIAARPFGGGRVSLADANGKAAVGIFAGRPGVTETGFSLLNRNGGTAVEILVDSNGRGKLSLFNANGTLPTFTAPQN